jgi:hypothetical protein
VSPFSYVTGTADISYTIGNVILAGNLSTGNIVNNNSGGSLIVYGNMVHRGDISVINGGNLTVTNGNTYVSSIQERISSTALTVSGSATTLVYNNGGGGTIYQMSSTAFTSNYTLNITNLPSVTDPNRTYVVSVINNTASAGYNCNAVTLSTTSAVGSAAPLLFSGGNSYTSSASVKYSTQQFAIVYHSVGGVYVLTTYNQFYDK